MLPLFDMMLKAQNGEGMEAIARQFNLAQEQAAQAMAALMPAGRVAVVSPYNPHGRQVPTAENEARRRREQQELTTRGLRHLRVDGLAPDGSQCEDGYAVELPRNEARELAERWGQSAFFWFDGSDFWLVPAELDAEAVRLPAS